MFEEIKSKISKSNTNSFSKEQVFGFLNQCTIEVTATNNVIIAGKVFKPVSIKRYDLLYAHAGAIPHPCVVIRIRDNNVYCLPITSQPGKQNIKSIERSRFFEKNYFYNNIIVLSTEEAMKSFVGVFDSKKEVDEAVRNMKEFYSKIL